MIATASKANEQRCVVLAALRCDFLGTPPSFDDAVRVRLLCDRTGQIYPLPPQIWINEQEAQLMLASGRAAFNYRSANVLWSPVLGGDVSGILLVASAALPVSLQVNETTGDEATTGLSEQLRTIAFPSLKAFLEKHGKDSQARLWDSAKAEFRDKHVPRQSVIRAIDELWGRPGRTGRPKSRRNKSP